MNRDTNILEVRGLGVEYYVGGGLLRAVDGVSFDVKKGGALAIVGESGSGKTTIASALMGLIMSWEGRIREGSAVFGADDGEIIEIIGGGAHELGRLRGREISLIPQDTAAALDPLMRIYPQIAEAATADNVGKKEKSRRREARRATDDAVREKVMAAARKARFPSDALDAYPHQLSGGQKQRSAIAAALVNSPSLIIADEPTSGLDAAVAREILSTLKELKSSRRLSIIMITHDIRAAAEMCDDAVIMYAGRVCERAPLKSIIHAPKHPYSVGLMNAILSVSKITDGVKPVEGSPPVAGSFKTRGCRFAERCAFKMEICEKSDPPLLKTSAGYAACFLFQCGGETKK
ncbi:MAG: ABC transporter ATP-binding protein [Endomicrobiia bacterium]|nr:ABC transporter ATP-binding protein [Endomicrobiia bacterium]